MTQEQFYKNLATYLTDQKYALGADPDVIRRSGQIPLWMTIAATAIGGIQGGLFAHSAGVEHAATRTAELEAVFAPMQALTPVVTYKFMLGSVLIFSAIEADQLSDGDILGVTHTFDTCLLNARPFASQRTYLFAWKQQAGAIQGTLMFIFQDSAKSDHFRSTLQKKCCTRHFGKLTSFTSTAVDIPRQQVFTHQPIKLLTTMADKDLTKKLFPAAKHHI